ncbi:MAG: ACT domain-containing protein [Spirochaetales bacterium]
MLRLSILSGKFGICRFEPSARLPVWAMDGSFFSITRTPEELSIVCPEDSIPNGTHSEKGWRCLKVLGPLPFELTGVLSSLAEPLARAGVSIFAISTHDTDYLMVKEHDLSRAVETLRIAGHRVAAGYP